MTNPEHLSDLTVVLLLATLLSVLTVGSGLMFWLIRHWDKRKKLVHRVPMQADGEAGSKEAFDLTSVTFDYPSRWLAIRSTNPIAAQAVLNLHNAKECSWYEGLSQLTDQALFISPPIEGWLLVVGSGLPDPSDDVDECFRFVLKLSRELGHVQFFSLNRAVNHHAWVRAEGGAVVRAYAWADETVWNQGPISSAERDVGMQCLAYGAEPESLEGNSHLSNTDRVLLLAAKWSLDPTNLDHRRLSAVRGIAGNLSHF